MICIEYNTYEILDQKKIYLFNYKKFKKNLLKIKMISKKI